MSETESTEVSYRRAVSQEAKLVDLLVAVAECLDAGMTPEHIVDVVQWRVDR